VLTKIKKTHGLKPLGLSVLAGAARHQAAAGGVCKGLVLLAPPRTGQQYEGRALITGVRCRRTPKAAFGMLVLGATSSCFFFAPPDMLGLLHGCASL
jgi:hypothetical protein